LGSQIYSKSRRMRKVSEFVRNSMQRRVDIKYCQTLETISSNKREWEQQSVKNYRIIDARTLWFNKSIKIDELIVNLFTKRILPLSIVQWKEFRQLLSFLGPKYMAFDTLNSFNMTNKLQILISHSKISKKFEWTLMVGIHCKWRLCKSNAHQINKNWQLVNLT